MFTKNEKGEKKKKIAMVTVYICTSRKPYFESSGDTSVAHKTWNKSLETEWISN